MTTPSQADPIPIPRVEAPSAEEFRARYFDPAIPVVISGAFFDWPALGRWTRRTLAETPSPGPVPVDVYEHGNYFEIGGALGHRKRIQLPFSEYLDACDAAGRARYYAPDLELSVYFPELARQVSRPALLPREAGPRFFLFAGRAAVTAGHYHPFTHALTCQVVGKRKVVVYPPEAGPSLYPFPWFSPSFYWSRVDFLRPDGERFPKLASAQAYECELEPGDALFIPVHFWHWTQGLDFGASVLVSWEAEIGSWHFPVPGYRCLLARATFPAEQLARRAASRVKNRLLAWRSPPGVAR